MANNHSDASLVEYVIDDKASPQYLKLSLKNIISIGLSTCRDGHSLMLDYQRALNILIGGIISGALLLGKYNITEDVFLAELMTKNAAGV